MERDEILNDWTRTCAEFPAVNSDVHRELFVLAWMLGYGRCFVSRKQADPFLLAGGIVIGIALCAAALGVAIACGGLR